MKNKFSRTTRTALKAALDLIHGGNVSLVWAEGFDFFSKIVADNQTWETDMEIVVRDYVFWYKDVEVIRVEMEGVAFNTEEHDVMRARRLHYLEDHNKWCTLNLC